MKIIMETTTQYKPSADPWLENKDMRRSGYDEMPSPEQAIEAYERQQQETRKFYEKRDQEQAQAHNRDKEERYRHSPNEGDNAVTLADKWVLEAQMSGPQYQESIADTMEQLRQERRDDTSPTREVPMPGRR